MNLMVKEQVYGKLRAGEGIEEYKQYGVYIYAAFNTYRADFEYLESLREAIKKEWPQLKDKDMEVRWIPREDSIQHAHFTTVAFKISYEEYMELYVNQKINVL